MLALLLGLSQKNFHHNKYKAEKYHAKSDKWLNG